MCGAPKIRRTSVNYAPESGKRACVRNTRKSPVNRCSDCAIKNMCAGHPQIPTGQYDGIVWKRTCERAAENTDKFLPLPVLTNKPDKFAVRNMRNFPATKKHAAFFSGIFTGAFLFKKAYYFRKGGFVEGAHHKPFYKTKKMVQICRHNIMSKVS